MIFFLFVFFFLIAAPAFAGDATAVAGANSSSQTIVSSGNSEAAGTASSNVVVDTRDQSQNLAEVKRPHLFVLPGTGTFIFPPSNMDGGDWKPFMYQALFREFTVADLEDLRVKNKGIWRSLTKNYIKRTLFSSRIQKMKENNNPIVRLDWYPTGDARIGYIMYPTDQILGETQLVGQEDWTDIAPLLLGLLDIKEQTRTSRVCVFYRPKKEPFNKGRSLGTGAAGGIMVGNAASADDKALGIALGGLWGTTWAGIWKSFDFKLWALNDGPIEPPQSWWKLVTQPPPPPPRAEAAPPPPPPSAAPKPSCAECETRARELEREKEAIQQQFDELVARKPAEAPPLEACPVSIEFPFKYWDLTKKDVTGKDYTAEKAKIPRMAQYIINNWTRIEKVGEFIFVGHADARPSRINATGENFAPDVINDPLGFQRANMTRALVLDELRKRGFGPEKIRKIKSVSSGKRWRLIDQARNEDEHRANRQVYLVVAIPGLHGYASK